MDGEKDIGKLFDWFEYAVFGFTLSLSVFIGVYFGFISKTGQNTVEGYVLGQKQITLLPMAMSLVSSFTSGIALLGLGAEVYVYGTQYMLSVLAMIACGIVNAVFFLPVFFKLQVVSVYEYLEVRFDHRIRKAGSLIYAFYLASYIPIVIYAPALALNQVGRYANMIVDPNSIVDPLGTNIFKDGSRPMIMVSPELAELTNLRIDHPAQHQITAKRKTMPIHQSSRTDPTEGDKRPTMQSPPKTSRSCENTKIIAVNACTTTIFRKLRAKLLRFHQNDNEN